MSLRTAALACHVLLVAALVITLGVPDSPLRLVVAAVVIGPLLATLPALWHGQRAIAQRLAVVLVLYSGGASVEVVARLGQEAAPVIALFAALLEFGLLLVLIRRGEPRAARE